jgi:hypothetical protein
MLEARDFVGQRIHRRARRAHVGRREGRGHKAGGSSSWGCGINVHLDYTLNLFFTPLAQRVAQPHGG